MYAQLYNFVLFSVCGIVAPHVNGSLYSGHLPIVDTMRGSTGCPQFLRYNYYEIKSIT